jgi:hypothetical protein
MAAQNAAILSDGTDICGPSRAEFPRPRYLYDRVAIEPNLRSPRFNGWSSRSVSLSMPLFLRERRRVRQK